ncbi:MAG: hypothetical protein QOG40_2184 [Solirubrobacteraceae bacterium]|nr:hypothetical protein [Solirubrobacteraceae bacterium]
MLQARKAVAPVCAAVAVAALAIASPASSLDLVGVTVTAPTVTVPTVTVKTPPVTVTTPSVPVKTPTVTVKTPTIPVKTPTVPIKTPTVTVKTTATAPSTAISTKTPSVAVGTSTGSVSVSGASVATGTTSSSSGRSTSPTQSSSTGKAVAGQGMTSAGGGSGALGGGSLGTAPGPLSAYAGIGYGQLPASEGHPGRRARARIARRERMLKAEVARFQGCLGVLPTAQRELLELRTGLRASRPLGPRAVATRLHLGQARFARLETQAVRELRAAASTHGCSRIGEFVAGVASFIGAGFGGGQLGATGGVKAVSYSAPAPKPAGVRSSTIAGLLGAGISTVASDVLLGLLLLMAGGVAVTVILADAAGLGPRHEQWRRRVLNSIRWMR